MSEEKGFNPQLLKQPREVRQAWFDSRVISHARLTSASDKILKTVRAHAGAEVVLVIGPTGVGKTTLMEHVMRAIIERALPNMKKNPGYIPTASITCQNPTLGIYDWTEHFTRILIALKEVLIDRKIYLPEAGPLPDEVKSLVKREKGNQRALRRAAENTLKYRELSGFFVDEAQYIIKGKSEEGVINQADTVRSMADASNTLHVLLGHYDLIALRNLNGQLGRRSRTVHFTRYYIDDKEDLKEFATVFKTLQAKLPLPNRPQLGKHLEFAFERTVGCIGRLKNWFSRCLDTALEMNCPTVTDEIFVEEADDISVCRQAAVEISEGEAKLKQYDDALAEAELRILLKKGATLKGTENKVEEPYENPAHVSAQEVEQANKSTKKKGGRKKIETNPQRLPTGVSNVAS